MDNQGDKFVCTKDSYICSLHFVGGNGPTKENPDPVSAVASKEKVRIYVNTVHLSCKSFANILF